MGLFGKIGKALKKGVNKFGHTVDKALGKGFSKGFVRGFGLVGGVGCKALPIAGDVASIGSLISGNVAAAGVSAAVTKIGGGICKKTGLNKIMDRPVQPVNIDNKRKKSNEGRAVKTMPVKRVRY